MPIYAKAPANTFIPAPPGAHAAVCVDVVDLGDLEVSFGGKNKRQHKIRIVWQIEEVMADNRPFIVQRRYTNSLHEKASLRKDLESWRGRAFTDQELEGFDLENLLNVGCLLNVIQQVKDGSTFSNVASIMKLPKTMQAPKPRDYVRVCDRTPEQAQADPDTWSPADEDVPF